MSKSSKKLKIQKVIETYPNEFLKSNTNDLYCNLCHVSVNYKKKYYIKRHRKSQKHIKNIENNKSYKQLPLQESMNSNNSPIIKAFIDSDIPLYKLRHQSIKNLFSSINIQIPSESTARKYIDSLSSEILAQIKKNIQDKHLFLIVDESEINSIKFINVLVGTLKNPFKSWLVECRNITGNPCASIICQVVDDTLKFFNVERNHFSLLISDAARYMISAAKSLKLLYPSFLHHTCLAHLLHNGALRIKTHYTKIDKLIATVKMATVKNSDRRQQFSEIGLPPRPVLTRWGSWIGAALYYSKNLNTVQQIVNSWDGEGVLEKNAISSVNSLGLYDQLVDLQKNYGGFLKMIEEFSIKTMTIENGVKRIIAKDFLDDPCGIKKYFLERVEKNGSWILFGNENGELRQVSPLICSLLLGAQGTSIEVERSFSMLGKLLRKDRNFKLDNIKSYIINYYNASN